MKSILVLISGRGSNLQALLEAHEREGWDARFCAVIASRADAPGLAIARAFGVATETIDARACGERAVFDAALAHALQRHAPDLVLLAGFMRVLPDALVARYAGRMLNVHPSLLPAFAGRDTHRRALEAGVKFHGATVHFVTADLDGGPIVAQAVVPVHDDDTEDTLAARVLEAEHRLYPRAVRWFLEGRLAITGSRVLLAAEPAALLDSPKSP